LSATRVGPGAAGDLALGGTPPGRGVGPGDHGLEHDPAAQGRVVAALAARAIRVQFRRAQFLIPAFLLPLALLAVIASGTSAARDLSAFPDTGAYVGFVVGGTLMQGALLAGLTAGIALAGDIEGGFFDRLLTAPLQRVTIILGRVVAAAVLGVAQGLLFLGVAFLFGARYTGGVSGVLMAVTLGALTAATFAGLAGAIALRTGSLSLLQNLFPLTFVLLFTAPAFFPRDLLNPTAEAIAQYNPLTYIVEGIRGALYDNPDLGDPWLGIAIGIGLVVLMSAVADFALRRRLASQ
jgi:ABC-2 type transport system permease protein